MRWPSRQQLIQRATIIQNRHGEQLKSHAPEACSFVQKTKTNTPAASPLDPNAMLLPTRSRPLRLA
jgi:hypothetical protein